MTDICARTTGRPSRPLRVLVAALVMTLLPGAAVASEVPAEGMQVRIASPRDSVVDPRFAVDVEVTAGSSPVTALDLQVWETLRQHHVLSPPCTATCTVTLDVDATSWPAGGRPDGPLDWYGDLALVAATAADGSTATDTTRLTASELPPAVYRLAANPRERDLSRGPSYAYLLSHDVLHLAASGADGSARPAAGVEARLTAREGSTPTRTVTAVPVVAAGSRWRVDDLAVPTADLPEGWYDVTVRASDGRGAYGRGQRLTVAVRHPPYVTWTSGPTLLTVGDRAHVTARMPGPLPVRTPLTAVLTVAPAGTTQGRTTTSEVPVEGPFGELFSARTGGDVTFDASSVAAAPGTWTATWQVVDADRRPFGDPLRTTYRVTGAAAARWSPVPPAQRVAPFGVASSVELTAPSGRTVESCWLQLVRKDGSWRSPVHDACPGRSGSRVTASADVSVPTSGSYVVQGGYRMGGRSWPVPPLAVAVLTSTRVALAVPDLSHGQRVDAVATVTRLVHGPTSPAAPQPGAAVSFEVRWAGESAWRRVGSATTGRDGLARLSVRPGRGGTWRAVTAYGGDAGTPSILSPEDAVAVRAAVRITSAPARAGSTGTITLSGTVSPGALGPRAVLQGLAPGARAWTDLASAPVASTGAVSVRTVLPTKGTWRLRLVQPGTTAVATGTSATVGVSVT